LKSLVRYAPPVLVVSRPDRPKGRRRILSPTVVKAEAERMNLPVATPESPNAPEFVNFLKTLKPDFIFLADFGAILKEAVLDVPRVAPLGMHPSLLPKYRGAAPIEHAFFNCERLTGVSVFIMERRIDAGRIVLQETLEIDPCNQTRGEVLPLFAALGARLLYEGANMLLEGSVEPRPQVGEVSYAPKIRPEDEFIKPEEGVMRTVGRINGLSPAPGARYRWSRGGRVLDLKLLKASPHSGDVSVPLGEFHYDRRNRLLLLGCSDGAARIHLLKVAGKPRPFNAEEFANGYLRR